MSTGHPRETLRESFDEVAALYDAARPGYPQEVFHDLAQLAGLQPGARILEIGAGTGHATLPLAQRGFRIDGIELGAQMAAVAQANLAKYPNVTITVADFDTWQGASQYELVFSASAYHWLNPATRVQRIAERIAPHGHVATIRNYHVQGEVSAQLNAATQQIYKSVFPHLAQKGLPRVEEIEAADAREWTASALFSHEQTRLYRWQTRLSAEEYVQMLDTHSDHRMMPPGKREQLFTQLRNLIDSSFGGTALKEYATLLQVAEKIS